MPKFSSARVLVVGDVMLDRYWFGDAKRISPEAPVPVVHVLDVLARPGGAANVATNIANLGTQVRILSAIGRDDAGRELLELLHASGVECDLLQDESLQTIVKLRVIARNQQVVRADFECPPKHEVLLPLLARFENALAQHNVIVFSDYGKGGLAHLEQMMALARARGHCIIIDPKGIDYAPYLGATLLTPNRDEFTRVMGAWSSEAAFERKAFALRAELQLEALLVTRSEEGMSLFVGERHIRIHAQAREIYDVSGAGDTVVAVLAAALGGGVSFERAAVLANYAAGIVVGKLGTTPITLQELVDGDGV